MHNIVISDTSCLIILDNINHLWILKELYHEVYTTNIIAKEYGKPLPEWIIIEEVKDIKYQKLLQIAVDEGEASAIALAFQFINSLLLIDDLKARKLAKKLNLKFTGTLGILVKAKKSGIIKEIKPILKLILETNFRLSDATIKEILKQAGE